MEFPGHKDRLHLKRRPKHGRDFEPPKTTLILTNYYYQRLTQELLIPQQQSRKTDRSIFPSNCATSNPYIVLHFGDSDSLVVLQL